VTEAEPVLSKIAEDRRGASWSIKLPDGQEVILIHTKLGFWRGGHSHNVREVSVLLSGRALYVKRTIDHTRTPVSMEETFIQGPGGVLRNEAGQDHAALALEDYWLVDMRPGSYAEDVKNTNYKPLRDLVDQQVEVPR